MINQEEIHKQCFSDNSEERVKALDNLIENFSSLPDKQQAWNDLHKLTVDKDWGVRYRIASSLEVILSIIPDKQQLWNDLIKLATDKDWDVKFKAASALSSTFSQVPDKQQAWNDLHKLTSDNDWDVRYRITSTIGSVFSDIPDKQHAWNDLIELITDNDSGVRHKAASAIDSVYSEMLDKQQAWNDLHKLTANEYNDVRSRIASILGSVFSDTPDKQQVWDDLIKLTTDEDRDVRHKAASALGLAFLGLPDKQQAWNDLIKLATDENSYVGLKAISVLGSAFSQVPDKQQAWNDLTILTTDKKSYVRAYANHSLGKVFIFRASQSEKEEDYRKELEKAIDFFEKSAQESSYRSHPSQFCLPFYRSFHNIIFEKQESKEEVNKYLVKAKYAIGGSKSKKLLFEAVENLSNALKEVQNLENLDLQTMKGELNFYRKYCENAADLIRDTEETAPYATATIRKGLPILNKTLKELLEEIQQKAKIACKESKGTNAEEIACTINREIQTWEIGSKEEMAFNVENLIFTLESNIPKIQENQYIFNRIQQIREQKDVPKQFGIVSTIIPLIPKIYMEQTVGELKNDIKEIKEKVDYVTISLKPGIKEEIEISVGTEILGTGVTHKITIPLQEISYSELKEDLEKITGKRIDKLSKVPKRLANKIKGYLLLHDKEDILEKLI